MFLDVLTDYNGQNFATSPYKKLQFQFLPPR